MSCFCCKDQTKEENENTIVLKNSNTNNEESAYFMSIFFYLFLRMCTDFILSPGFTAFATVAGLLGDIAAVSFAGYGLYLTAPVITQSYIEQPSKLTCSGFIIPKLLI